MARRQLNPSTASLHRSIWQGINRNSLEQDAKKLNKSQHVPGRLYYSERAPKSDDGLYALPLSLEKSLADDLAFIAAVQPQVDYVSAVTIEQNLDGKALNFRLAANTGVTHEVREGFNALISILQQNSRKGKVLARVSPSYVMTIAQEFSRQVCQERLFKLITQMNFNRVLGRLRSKWFRRPSHIYGAFDPLPLHIKKFYQKNSIRSASRPQSYGVDPVLDDIIRFEESFKRLELSSSDDALNHLQEVIRCSYALTENGTKLPERLRLCGCPAGLVDVREVREVGKVANYWRIARHLTVCSRRFSELFKNVSWTAQSCYSPALTSTVVGSQFVHAEIQLITHYELNPYSLPPRAIGASKEACFLCDSFIRAYGRYCITGAHRQVFDQWTVPDLKEYTNETLNRFREVLAQVSRDVKRERTKANSAGGWRPQPLQSAINLHVAQLSSPSNTTIGAATAIDLESVADPSGNDCFSMTSNTGRDQCSGPITSLESRSSKDRCSGECTSLPPRTLQESETVLELSNNGSPLQPTGWIEIFATFVRTPMVGIAESIQQQCLIGSVALVPVGSTHCRRISLEDIPYDQDLILDKYAEDDANTITFIIQGDGGEEAQIRCRWDNSTTAPDN